MQALQADHPRVRDLHRVNLGEQQTCIFLDTEFAPTFVHFAGVDDTGADSLSRLPMSAEVAADAMGHLFAISHLDRIVKEDFSLDMRQIHQHQLTDPAMQHRLTPHNGSLPRCNLQHHH